MDATSASGGRVSRWTRFEHSTRSAFRELTRGPRWLGWGAIAVGVLASWLIGLRLGGEQQFPPHWFYLVVIYGAVRFGYRGALAAAVASTIFAGPLMPERVSPYIVQPPSDWLTRGAFFLLVGQAIALLCAYQRSELECEIERLHRDRELRIAIVRDQFEVHYQPIVDLQSGRLVGTEALARWRHPQRGLLGPSEFIPHAEASDLIVDVGEKILRQACADHAARSGPRTQLAVNISARQLADAAFPERIERVLRETQFDPASLVLEVTETALVDDPAIAAARLRTMKALGIRIALDDFGTGQSSLAYLQQYPADTVKIDRSFVAQLGAARPDATVAAGIIRLAHQLGMRTLGEGVETREQVAILRSLGCMYGQGFYFAKPLPAAEIEPLLRHPVPFVRHITASKTAFGPPLRPVDSA